MATICFSISVNVDDATVDGDARSIDAVAPFVAYQQFARSAVLAVDGDAGRHTATNTVACGILFGADAQGAAVGQDEVDVPISREANRGEILCDVDILIHHIPAIIQVIVVAREWLGMCGLLRAVGINVGHGGILDAGRGGGIGGGQDEAELRAVLRDGGVGADADLAVFGLVAAVCQRDAGALDIVGHVAKRDGGGGRTGDGEVVAEADGVDADGTVGVVGVVEVVTPRIVTEVAAYVRYIR